MMRTVDTLRDQLRSKEPQVVAANSGTRFSEARIGLSMWQQQRYLNWPELVAYDDEVNPCSTFDTAMILYYLNTADGTPMADRWISFRELDGGSFYAQAFQGYSGDRISRYFTEDVDALHRAAGALDGIRLTALTDHAYAFMPLPRIRLAVALWLGDEDFPTSASVLFDASSNHYMTTDGMALLGSGLASRLERAAPRQA